MKKFTLFLILLTLFALCLVSCGNEEPKDINPNRMEEYTLSVGIVSTPALSETNPGVTLTAASVIWDKYGKIVACRIDEICYEALDEDGKINTAAPKSKVDLGYDYDVLNQMPAGEWFLQAEGFEDYINGKTVDEVMDIKVDKNGRPTDADYDLTASCTIAIDDMQKAIYRAFKAKNPTVFLLDSKADLKMGLAYAAEIAANETDASAVFTATVSASAVSDGKIISTVADCIDAKLSNLGNAELSYIAEDTYREQGDSYVFPEGNEGGAWYVQANSFAKATLGKSASEISEIAPEDIKGCYLNIPLLKSVTASSARKAR